MLISLNDFNNNVRRVFSNESKQILKHEWDGFRLQMMTCSHDTKHFKGEAVNEIPSKNSLYLL